MKPFTASRDDGRSDRKVVFDLVKDADPDTMFTYQEIQDALSVGLDEPATKARVYPAVALANKTLLAEKQRFMRVARGKGYRVIRANEHIDVALYKKDRAEQQFKAGLSVLREVRVDELNPNERRAHEGTLLLVGGLVQGMRETNRRLDRLEAIVETVTKPKEDKD